MREGHERENNQLLLEKGLNVLGEVLKKTSIIAGKEFTIDELKEIEERQEVIRAENIKKNYRIFSCEKRKRGRPKKPILIDPNATRLAEEAKLKEQRSSNLKVVSTSPFKDCLRKKKHVKTVKVDLNQYVFEVDDDEVEVPIEVDEEGKRLKMYIIEVSSEDDIDNIISEGSLVEPLNTKIVPVIDESSIIKPAGSTDLTKVSKINSISISIV